MVVFAIQVCSRVLFPFAAEQAQSTQVPVALCQAYKQKMQSADVTADLIPGTHLNPFSRRILSVNDRITRRGNMRRAAVPHEHVQLWLVDFVGRSDAGASGFGFGRGRGELRITWDCGKRVGGVDD